MLQKTGYNNQYINVLYFKDILFLALDHTMEK